MARRVKQADGSYCYTENCRIHDRSGDSTGLQAVIDDSNFRRVEKFVSTVSEAVQSELGVSQEVADRIGARVMDVTMNSQSALSNQTLVEAIKEEGINADEFSAHSTTFKIHNRLSRLGNVQIGDEVILMETGERGVITEGDSSFGGPVRFNPENTHSKNSFAWVKAGAVTKLISDKNSLARERIFAAPRDSLIPADTVKQMLDEETNPETRNAQGTKDVGRQGAAARENILNLGDRIVAHYGSRAGMTKGRILSVLNKEYERPVDSSMTEEEAKATKSALRNIITYLDPTGDRKS